MPKHQHPHFLSVSVLGACHQIFTNASGMQMLSVKVVSIHFKMLVGLYLHKHVSAELYTVETTTNGASQLQNCFFSVNICSRLKVDVVHLLLSEMSVLHCVCCLATCGHRFIFLS